VEVESTPESGSGLPLTVTAEMASILCQSRLTLRDLKIWRIYYCVMCIINYNSERRHCIIHSQLVKEAILSRIRECLLYESYNSVNYYTGIDNKHPLI